MKAKFMFWQTLGEGFAPVPYYNLLQDVGVNPKGTTISAGTLTTIGVHIPPTPSYEEYVAQVAAGKRCKACWSQVSCQHRIIEGGK